MSSVIFHFTCVIILILILIAIWYILYIRSNKYIKSESQIDKLPFTDPLSIGNKKIHPIVFVSRKYINQIIEESNYFNRMNNIDLYVRDVNSIQSYINLYKVSLKEFTYEEKSTLNKLCKSIDEYIAKTKNLLYLQWKFAKQSTDIENGWPHTLGDVIILSGDFFTINSLNTQILTLLHEKIHIYQRMLPFETNKLFIDLDFKPAIKIEDIQLARNNPDINDFVYEKNGKIFVQLYNSRTPNNISDSKTYIYNNKDTDNPINISQKNLDISNIVSQYEHPNEIMATIIPQIIINNFDEKTEFIKKIKLWILNYL